MSLSRKIISCSLLIASTIIAGEKNITLQQFDSDVLKTQIEVQKSCQLTQKLFFGGAAMSARNVASSSKLAIKHLSIALKNWKNVKEKYKNSIPEQYRKDTLFTRRIENIENSIIQMNKQLAENNYGATLKECGGMDRQLVEMHEENGLVYATDKLFHLQMAVKTFLTLADSVSVDSLGILIKPILDIRNQVISVSNPYKTSSYEFECYSTRIDSLSINLDALAQAIAVRNEKEIKKSIQVLPQILDKAYDAALNCTGAEKLRDEQEETESSE